MATSHFSLEDAGSISNEHPDSLFANLVSQVDVKFKQLRQMLDIRQQILLNKIADFQKSYKETAKRDEAIKNVNESIQFLKSKFEMDMLQTCKDQTIPLLEINLTELKSQNVNRLDISSLQLICDTNKFQDYINTIDITSDKIVLDYAKRTAPVLVKGKLGTGQGEMNGPNGICIDKESNDIYVGGHISKNKAIIKVFSSDGEFKREFGKKQLSSAFNVFVTSTSVFVVSSNESHCLVKFAKNGQFVKKVGSHGSKDGQFSWPQGLCVASELVYVCDNHNHRIQVFDLDLNYSSKFHLNELRYPQDIKCYSNQIFVNKQNLTTVFVFSLDGTYLKSILLTGDSSIFNGVYFFTIDLLGNFIFSMYDADCIGVYSASGDYISALGRHTLSSPSGIDVDGEGRIICFCMQNEAVIQFF